VLQVLRTANAAHGNESPMTTTLYQSAAYVVTGFGTAVERRQIPALPIPLTLRNLLQSTSNALIFAVGRCRAL